MKAILRTMTDGAKKEKQKEQKTQQSSVRTALKEVIQGTELPSRPERPKLERKQEAPRPQKHEPPPPKSDGPRPFEIPEDTLREIFKDNV